jgi:CheY-like chemotaxis protein
MRKLTVWVIEDDELERGRAINVVEEVGRAATAFSFDIWNSASLLWPPVSKDGAQARPACLPDVVILDLFDDGLRGDSFYRKLREEEEEKQCRPAFVVIWSRYSGVVSAENFIEETTKKDGNFIPLDTKSQYLLRERLSSLVERIEEES